MKVPRQRKDRDLRPLLNFLTQDVSPNPLEDTPIPPVEFREETMPDDTRTYIVHSKDHEVVDGTVEVRELDQ